MAANEGKTGPIESGSRPRFILFGLDGATLDILEPAVAQGKLPTIGRLMRRGSHGVLQSIIPPITAAAWTTLMTGVNPGKHGIFEFYTLQENSYNPRLVSSEDRKSLAIWDLLNQCGLSVGVVNVPITYPPDQVTGWMISGMMGAPDFGKAVCWPPQLASEVGAVVDRYPMGQVPKSARGSYDFRALQQQISSRTSVTIRLLRTHPVDVLIVVCNYTDHVQHWFWRDCGLTTPSAEHIEDMVLYAYQQADRFLGQLLDFCGEQTTVFLVSDHGAGPIEEHLNMERFLLDAGLMTVEGRQGPTILERAANLTPQWLRRKLPGSWRQAGWHWLRQQRVKRIDWPRTRAFNVGSYLGLRLNVEGREPQGCIHPDDYYDQRQEIRALLEDYRHPNTGAPVFEVYTGEELYHGPYVSQGPDLLGIIGEEKIQLADFAHPTRTPVLVDWEQMGKVAPHSRTGGHRCAGVLIAAGPNVRANGLDNEAQIVDIVPTMLYALGLSIPIYCDGRALTELFTAAFTTAHPPSYTETDMRRQFMGEAVSVYSERESEQITQRLRDLGYLE